MNNKIPTLQGLGIGIVALSGALPNPDELTTAIQWFENQGAHVSVSKTAYVKEQRFAGNDTQRLQALYEFIDREDISVILAARGGYGLTRLLPQIDFFRIARSGQCLVGHSDFNTVQLALLAQTGTPSLVGPMACYDFSPTAINTYMLEHFLKALFPGKMSICWPIQRNSKKHNARFSYHSFSGCEGCLWGGNLSVLMSLLGTPYFPNIEQGILFLEDVNEHPYRIERMLLQLLQAGVLQKQQAILLGSFSNYRLSDYDAGYNLTAGIAAVRQCCPIPIIEGLPFGHCPEKTSLRLGSLARLERQGQQWKLLSY